MAELKPGWKRVRFGDVVRLNKENCKDPEAEGIERVIGLEHLEPGDLRIRSWGDVADGTTFTKRVRPGQVLFGKRRAYQRKVAIADFDAVCSGDILVFESKGRDLILPGLVPYICQSAAFFSHAIETSAGSLSPRTSWKHLAEYPFPLPPIDEQVRISSRLQASRSLQESLLAADKALAVLRKSLLENTLSRLHGARTVRIGDIATVVRGSTPRPAGDPRYFNGEAVPWITVGEITNCPSMYISATATALTAEGAKRSRLLASGTVVLSNSGWTLGVPRILAIDGCANDGVAAFLDLSDEIMPEYLYYSLERLTEYFRSSLAAGGDQPNLNTVRISSVEIPLPPMSCQRALVSQMESLNSAHLLVQHQEQEARRISLIGSGFS